MYAHWHYAQVLNIMYAYEYIDSIYVKCNQKHLIMPVLFISPIPYYVQNLLTSNSYSKYRPYHLPGPVLRYHSALSPAGVG